MFYIGLVLLDLAFISSLVLICSVILRELVNPQESQVPGIQAGNDASLQSDFNDYGCLKKEQWPPPSSQLPG